MAGVTFDRVTKTYADGTTAVDALDLEITDEDHEQIGRAHV